MSNIITRGFVWIQEALGVDRAPDTLREDVQPILDADQRGYGHRDTEILPFAYTVDASSTDTTVDVLTGRDAATAPVAPDHSRQIILLSLSVQGTESSLPGDVQLTYRANVNGAVIIHSAATVGTTLETAAGTTVFMSPLAASSAFLPTGPLWVPRGFRPQLRIFAFDNIEVAGVAIVMRSGFSGGAP